MSLSFGSVRYRKKPICYKLLCVMSLLSNLLHSSSCNLVFLEIFVYYSLIFYPDMVLLNSLSCLHAFNHSMIFFFCHNCFVQVNSALFIVPKSVRISQKCVLLMRIITVFYEMYLVVLAAYQLCNCFIISYLVIKLVWYYLRKA